MPLATWGEFDQHKDAERWREVWIDLQPLRHRCKGQSDCDAQNRHRLALQVPDKWNSGLRAGVLGTVSEDETRLKVWKSIIRFFRTKTKTGIWVFDRELTALISRSRIRQNSGIDPASTPNSREFGYRQMACTELAKMKAGRKSKHMRYSPGVELLHREGLKLWPFAGEYEVFIDPPAIV